MSQEEFERSILKDEFIEFTRFANNYYGTSKRAVQEVQNSGKICILDVEMEGVKNLKKTDLCPRFVFIKPPSMEVLVGVPSATLFLVECPCPKTFRLLSLHAHTKPKHRNNACEVAAPRPRSRCSAGSSEPSRSCASARWRASST